MRKYVVLACVLSVLVTGTALAGCGGGGSGARDAEAAAKKFFSAYEQKDADTTWGLLSADSQKGVKKADWETFLKESESMKFTVGKVTEKGDTATAEVKGTISGDASTETIPLVKENGSWKVDMAGVETEE